MAPIRVALVGLSASAKVNWAAEAHLPYLNSARGKQHYELVALLDSSVKAAESAKMTFGLSSKIKAYGHPEKLAADPDVDLVVVKTRADVHFPVVEPSIRGGKGVFVEWPLVESLEKGIELEEKVLATDTVGKVLNSEVHAYGNLVQRDSLPESLTYFADRRVGGHPINIHYGHLIDYVHEILGDWQDFHAIGQIQRPSINAIGADGHRSGTVKSDVADYLSVHGTLRNNKGVVIPDATLLATFRLGPQFKGEPALVWTINGEKGELKLSAPGPYLMSGDSFDGPITIERHDHALDKVTKIEWDWSDWQKDFGFRARTTAELYERYADWVRRRPDFIPEDRQWPRLDEGVALLAEFDKLYKQIDPEW